MGNTIDVAYDRVQSAGKIIRTRRDGLAAIIHDTLTTISDAVGATLGPGGRPVVIQHPQSGRAPIVTKDGVTVFRNLGFEDTVKQTLMEAVRDSAVRTAQEAGDGTTTATVLAQALQDAVETFTDSHPRYSPQRVMRELEGTFKEFIEPTIRIWAESASIGNEEGRVKLKNVAAISANGDRDLANAVLECFDVVGDDGNVTLLEIEGESRYEVEQIQGYPLSDAGYERSCGKFYEVFINDQAKQMCVLEKPLYLLYNGKLGSIDPIRKLLAQVAEYAQDIGTRNVVVVAASFGEQAITELAVTFTNPHALKVYPVVLPPSPMRTGFKDVLMDLAAVTGGKLIDPMSYTAEEANVNDLGRTESFEAGRFRSSILGFMDEILILERAAALRAQLASPDIAILEKQLIGERLGKLTSGIAKLKIYGASNGELREKRDRAEDAVCAVRGALKHGILPGGGWTLVQLWNYVNHPIGIQAEIKAKYPGAFEVLSQALLAPYYRLYDNLGISQLVEEHRDFMIQHPTFTYDLLNMTWVKKIEGGVIDSTPAVLEAIRNSLSIAALLGTCGGVIVFGRDRKLEREEAGKEREWQRQLDAAESDPQDLA